MPVRQESCRCRWRPSDSLPAGITKPRFATGTGLARPSLVVMTYSIKFVGTEFVRLRIDGNLDATTVPDLEPMLARLVARQPWDGGAGTLAAAIARHHRGGRLDPLLQRLRMSGCHFTVTGLHDQPLAVFRLLRLDESWGI